LRSFSGKDVFELDLGERFPAVAFDGTGCCARVVLEDGETLGDRRDDVLLASPMAPLANEEVGPPRRWMLRDPLYRTDLTIWVSTHVQLVTFSYQHLLVRNHPREARECRRDFHLFLT
jgi:hypothetical protein